MTTVPPLTLVSLPGGVAAVAVVVVVASVGVSDVVAHRSTW